MLYTEARSNGSYAAVFGARWSLNLLSVKRTVMLCFHPRVSCYLVVSSALMLYCKTMDFSDFFFQRAKEILTSRLSSSIFAEVDFNRAVQAYALSQIVP